MTTVLQFLNPGLIDDAPEQINFLGHAGPGCVGALWPDLETGLI